MELVELPVQFMISWDFAVSLFDLPYEVKEGTQGSVEGGDGVVGW